MTDHDRTRTREAPAQLHPDEFRALGHQLVDRIGDFLASLADQPASPELTPERLQEMFRPVPLPERGADAAGLLERATNILFNESVLTGHPGFLAYILGAASPLAMLGDLLASAVNCPASTYPPFASPIAIETQTIRWVAELLGYPTDCGGLFLNGGSMANMLAVHAALHAKAGWDVKADGITREGGDKLRVYITEVVHASVTTAVTANGLGTRAIRKIRCDANDRMDVADLRAQIAADREAGNRPFMVVASAGTTGTGAVDPLREIVAICREQDLWIHVDGAYGGSAVVSPEAPDDLRVIGELDSLSIDPHKWLYMPAESACLLTRDPQALRNAYRASAPYYVYKDQQTLPGGVPSLSLRDQAPTTTRRLRALKMWLCLQHVGREGYARMITDDILLSRRLYDLVTEDPRFEALTQSLSVTTFRYVPADMADKPEAHGAYLDDLNREILRRLLASGKYYMSPTWVRGMYALRVCIVNYSTSPALIEALPELLAGLGAEADADLRAR